MFRLPLTMVVAACALAFASCNPIGPSVSTVGDRGGASLDAIDAHEQRVSEAIERARESAVALEYTAADGPSSARRVATGVVINEQGDVLSIRIDPPPRSAPIVARDASGRRRPAQWLATDPETGITLLRIPIGSSQVRPIRPAPRDHDHARLGSEVFVIGNPFGLGHSVSRGHIAGLGRRLELGPRQLGGLIQVDASLHPGDSGALVASLHGEWLGLIRSGLAAPDPGRTRDHDLGFAIPAADALWVADQLRARQRVDRAYLGVKLDLSGQGDSPGARLDGVIADGPASRAGLQSGDRVVALDGHPIQTATDLTDRLDRTLADTETTVEYQRGPRLNRLIVHTTRRPKLAVEPTSSIAPTAKTDDLRSPLPRDIVDRLEKLERRLDALDKRTALAPPQH